MIKTVLLPLLIFLLSVFPIATYAADTEIMPPAQPQKKSFTAYYLLPDAPTFDLTLTQFRKEYNADNPSFPLNEYRVIKSENETIPLIRAATRINAQLYSSIVLEKESNKIKSLQLTHLITQSEDEKEAYKILLGYMASLIRWFEPAISSSQSEKKVTFLLERAKRAGFYQQTEGAIRYIVVDNNDNSITFAIEPIKLTLAER